MFERSEHCNVHMQGRCKVVGSHIDGSYLLISLLDATITPLHQSIDFLINNVSS